MTPIGHAPGEFHVSTAAIIRGLLDAVDAAKVDLTQCRTEADVKAIVLARLG